MAAVLTRALYSGDSSLRAAAASKVTSISVSSILLDVQRLKGAALLQFSSEARALALRLVIT
jgi:hypothetical protein